MMPTFWLSRTYERIDNSVMSTVLTLPNTVLVTQIKPTRFKFCMKYQLTVPAAVETSKGRCPAFSSRSRSLSGRKRHTTDTPTLSDMRRRACRALAGDGASADLGAMPCIQLTPLYNMYHYRNYDYSMLMARWSRSSTSTTAPRWNNYTMR